ncbi:type IV pilus assembly protein PilY1 [Variovorax sp. PDC80]|uniref:pilus assembly protein n=1 Tax=Variovorax sp. PDC80 TaxID=1882827 RepID=UPI0008E5D823|nr:PilC/PilY family type IV pilus protein [Variovorax sp. PDC80]SFO68303.1 type IV pilus assembly protein PilY1 [Variovorax sp. PDC80]
MPLLRAFIVCIALVFCATWSAPAGAGIASTTPPDALLTSVPVHALAGQPDPNIVIDLSIKASNAGPAYLGGFEPAKVYEGYWDAKGCYDYLRVEGYFRRTATATTLAGGEIACRGQWSGNLLNWATASPLDHLRMALTGGDRVVDTPERTVLQRATWPIGAGVELSVKTVRGHLERLTPRSGLRADETLRIRNCGERLVVDADMRADADRGCVSAAGAELYFARVEVCAADEAVVRRDLCAAYPSGHHKPVGALQVHAGDARFAVFGYLPGSDPRHQGGVLREAMKSIGPEKTDAGFDRVANPRAEWDARTGVFRDDLAGTAQGVIAAVNRFGRSGDYARFDPAGELFHESLRYLQAKLPTPADPVLGNCQRHHILNIGDLDTGRDGSAPGSGSAAFSPDTAHWARLVGAFENRKAGAAQGSFGMAGLAYWAHTQRIRGDHPDLRVQTFAIDLDADRSAVVGTRQRGSALYLAAKYGGFVDRNGDGDPFRSSALFGAPDPTGKSAWFSNAEWAEGLDHDGQPMPANYFLASDARSTADALHGVLRRATAPPLGANATAALSSDTVGAAGASLYRSRSDSRRWAGTLLSFRLFTDPDTGALRVADTPSWDAGALLDARMEKSGTSAPRKIFTLSTAGVGIPFEWEALDEPLRRSLRTETGPASPMPAGATDTLARDRLNYLRGERRNEASFAGGRFRVRDSVMGDVAHAAPVYVGAPDPALREADHPAFLATHRQREPAVYLGANDGMLHAFSARTGEELFGYVPRLLFPALGQLAQPGGAHRAYVDGTPTVADARMANGPWKSVLVSGLGAGAAGVFALDVSDPRAFSADKVLWEFGSADDPDMGHLMQPPRILKFRTKAATAGRPATHAWFAVVPSGFNNRNPEKRAALFLLSLDKPAGTPWRRGLDYHKILLPRPADIRLVNALASAPGDHAADDGTVRWLYAGDTQGNLWKFDFERDAPWSEANALGFGGAPLMVAMDGGAGSRRQPITVPPEVGLGPGGGGIVLFGTGQFVELADLGASRRGVQTVYAVQDTGTPIRAGEARTQLAPRQARPIEGGLTAIEGQAFVYGAFDRATTRRRGWYLDLPASRDQGERLVERSVLADGRLFFNTLIPPQAACGEGGGRSCAVDAMTGLSKGGTCVPSEAGLLGAPFVVQQGDASYGAADPAGRRVETRRLSALSPGTRKGTAVSVAQPPDGATVSRRAGRLNWRQVPDPQGTQP